jgi:CheY-like chemotaxis protein
MSSNPWALSSHSPPAATPSDSTLDYRSRRSLAQLEMAERRKRELAEQSSDLNTPAERIRAWEQAHRLTLPGDSAHPVLSVVADATGLTLKQVHEEQRRRAAPARPRSVEPDTNATATRKHAEAGAIGSAQTMPAQATEAQQIEAREDEGGETAPSTQPLRILTVDNDMVLANSLNLMLNTSGYSQTRVAYSGHAALAMAAEFQPDVVLLDLDLSDMSGYEVARLLREHAGTNGLRLIALTSSRDHAGRELARQAGFERYLLKPVAPLDLSELLQLPGISRRPAEALAGLPHSEG